MAGKVQWLWHPDSPGIRIPVIRGFFGKLFKEQSFATLGETIFYTTACALRDAAYGVPTTSFVKVLPYKGRETETIPVFRIGQNWRAYATKRDARIFWKSLVFLEIVDQEYFSSDDPKLKAWVLGEIKGVIKDVQQENNNVQT